MLFLGDVDVTIVAQLTVSLLNEAGEDLGSMLVVRCLLLFNVEKSLEFSDVLYILLGLLLSELLSSVLLKDFSLCSSSLQSGLECSPG